MNTFKDAFEKIVEYASSKGVSISLAQFDSRFKGDLDGANIWIADHLDDEEKVFNALHLLAHTIQWAVNPRHKEIGAKLWSFPEEAFLKELVHYEYEASCLGLQVLREIGFGRLEFWLEAKYIDDICSLYHYYKTGRFLPSIQIRESYEFPRVLIPVSIPEFTPTAQPSSKRGIILQFQNA